MATDEEKTIPVNAVADEPKADVSPGLPFDNATGLPVISDEEA